MRTLLYMVTVLSVFGLAFWAYQENYATQQVLKETRKLRTEIATAQVRLNILRAEWAYLNRPDRLRDLAEINFDRLGLLPLRPDQFGRVDEIAYPQRELVITNGVEVSALNEATLSATSVEAGQ